MATTVVPGRRRTDVDYVVVGARVAGASTALMLARAGARVLLLDRAAYGSDTVSTHGFMRAGVLQLSRWGLLDALVAAGTPAIDRTVFHYHDPDAVHGPVNDSVRVSIRPSRGVPALYAPRRHVLDRLLVDAAVAAGVEVRHGVSVVGLLRDERDRVRGVRAVSRSGPPIEITCAVTIGADGIGSTVASAVGAPVLRRGRHGGAVLYGYAEGLDPEGYEWAYGPRVGAGLIPTNDGLTCVFVGGTPTAVRGARRAGAEAGFDAMLAAAAPALHSRVRAARRVGRLHGWAGTPGHVRQAWGPGWALVGDAGYFRDPITTHGMTDALRDADLLTGALQAWAAGDDSEAEALGRYQRHRDILSRELFTVSDEIASYEWDLPRLRPLLRQVSSATGDEVAFLESLTDWPDPVTGSAPRVPAFAARTMPGTVP